MSYLPPWQRNLGMVFQSYALWPHMTIRKNVAFGLEERRLPRSEIKARVKPKIIRFLRFSDLSALTNQRVLNSGRGSGTGAVLKRCVTWVIAW